MDALQPGDPGSVGGYRLLGRLGSAAAVMFRVVHELPDLAGLADPGLRELITSCLAKLPRARPEVTAVLTALTGSNLSGAVAVASRGTARAQVPAAAAVAVGTPRQAGPSALAGTSSQRELLPFPGATRRRPG